MTTIPERIREEARKAIYDTGRGMIGRERNYLEDRVCRALLAADKRGREEERERCAKLTEGIGAEIEVHSLNLSETMLGKSISSIAAAIRSTN